MIFCINLSKYRYQIQDKIDEVILDYKIKTTKKERQKVKKIVITSVMVMTVIVMLTSNVSAIEPNGLDSDTKEVLYYHFKNLHYPDAQIQQCIDVLNQNDIDKIVSKFNQKIASQRFPSDIRTDIGNLTGVIIYAIIFEIFRLAMMKISGLQ